ncbi:hypothetical protein [Mycobacterium intracellulare]|uniref:hypothetical protein n=1 Tax=Mycobacterium intracellulare TaxID=1767 RepID=UPI001EEEAC63|nr:hypothetical protein [Mycobacterium intracellulare]MEE3755332.1 hypothetical protein [Mycobacterium intracellulare]
MVNTSVDLGQLRATAQQLRDIANNDLTTFIHDQSGLVDSYRQDASANTLDGAPAGIFADTAAALEAGFHDAATKATAIKTELLHVADALEKHAHGVESDEADSSNQFSYGTAT